MNNVVIGGAPFPWALLGGGLIQGILVIGLTFFLTLGICSIHDRKKQFISTIFLLFVSLLWFTIPLFFPGKIPDAGSVFGIFVGYLIIALAIITPGILWFWPDERGMILKDTFMCSVFTLALGGLLYAGIYLLIPARMSVGCINGLFILLADTPGGMQLIRLILFTLFATLSFIGYWVLSMIQSKVSATG